MKKESIKRLFRSFIHVLENVVSLGLLALLCLRGQYRNLVYAIAGDLAVEEYLLVREFILEYTGGLFWKIISFLTIIFSFVSVKNLCRRIALAKASRVIVQQPELQEIRHFVTKEKKEKLNAKPIFVLGVLEMVPAFLN